MTMAADNPVRTLEDHGDLLEQYIVTMLHNRTDHPAASHARPVLEVYARVWCGVILPNRENGRVGHVTMEWLDFSGSHYSAFVRFFSAYTALNAIREASEQLTEGSEDEISSVVFALHRDTASFWWNIRCVLDNLGCALSCFPDSRTPCGEGREARLNCIENARALYEYGTRFIHQSLIPIAVHDGLPEIPNQWITFVEEQIGGRIDWNRAIQSWEELSAVYENVWSIACSMLTSGWHRLEHDLRQRGHFRSIGIADLPSEPQSGFSLGMNMGSASTLDYGGLSRPRPSGT